MIKKISMLMIGNIIATLGVAMVVNSTLGSFAITSANLSLSNLLGVRVGVAGILVEILMLSVAIYYKEGIGITTIYNAIIGSMSVDFFMGILPTHPLMVLGLGIIPIGWSIMGRIGLGETSSNLLMNALVKHFNKSLGLVRGIEECTLMAIGLIGARSYVTLFTILLSLFFGYFINYIYKLVKYDSVNTKHLFIIGGK